MGKKKIVKGKGPLRGFSKGGWSGNSKDGWYLPKSINHNVDIKLGGRYKGPDGITLTCIRDYDSEPIYSRAGDSYVFKGSNGFLYTLLGDCLEMSKGPSIKELRSWDREYREDELEADNWRASNDRIPYEGPVVFKLRGT